MAEERVTLFLFGTVLLFGLELTYTGKDDDSYPVSCGDTVNEWSYL